MIYNITRSTLIASDIEMANSFSTRLRGLMFRSHLLAGTALVLYPCRSVHTFFMRFPIDVAFLDESHKVVGVTEGLRPWRMSRLYLEASSVVELAAGMLANSGTKIGDMIEIRHAP